jgi:hypothetical protein
MNLDRVTTGKHVPNEFNVIIESIERFQNTPEKPCF